MPAKGFKRATVWPQVRVPPPGAVTRRRSRAMKAQGATVLVTQQNVELALDFSDRDCVRDQGAGVCARERIVG